MDRLKDRNPPVGKLAVLVSKTYRCGECSRFVMEKNPGRTLQLIVDFPIS